MSAAKQSTDWEKATLLHRINPDRNEARFYYVLVGRTLLDQHGVMRIWGRIGGHQRAMITPCQTEEEARNVANMLIQRRLKRGYRLVWSEIPEAIWIGPLGTDTEEHPKPTPLPAVMEKQA